MAPPTHKVCTICGIEKPATNEYFPRTGKYLEPRCKACVSARGIEYRKANPDKIKAQNKQARAKNKDTYAKKNKEWREANADRVNQYAREYRDKNRDLINENARKYQKRNPEKVRVHIHRRNARKRQLPNTLTAKQWADCLAYWGGCCAYCGRSAGLFHGICLEHFVPLSNPDCPGTTASNSLPACHGIGGCNGQKTDKPAAEWLESKFGTRKAKQILKRITAYFAWATQQPD